MVALLMMSEARVTFWAPLAVATAQPKAAYIELWVKETSAEEPFTAIPGTCDPAPVALNWPLS
jgi:hypothetical protein